jgi:glycosyltransferase involved in cell wall biosynthesis
MSTAKRSMTLYPSVDVVVMPSRHESFGLVAIEAMAAGALAAEPMRLPAQETAL